MSYINILRCLYNKVLSTVKWGTATSKLYKLSAGVRQGGVLSPFLFGIYVDGVMSKLANSGLGCFIKCNCFNSIMYADDLIILSISLHHLQSLLDICVHEFKSIGMSINLLKSTKPTVCQPITSKTFCCHALQNPFKCTNSDNVILCNKYGFDSNVNVNSPKFRMFKHFESVAFS